jgi:hypothetical protein
MLVPCSVALFAGGFAPARAVAAGPEAPITETCSGPIRAGGGWRLCGTLNPHSSQRVGSYFLYNVGTSCAGGAEVPAAGEVEGEDVQVSGEVAGLQAATQYSYCLVATNSDGEAVGGSVTFTTPGPEAPITETCLSLCPSPTPGQASGQASNLTSGVAYSLSTPAPLPRLSTVKPPTRAEKLAAALKRCAKERRKLRPSCEKAARRKYGTRITRSKKS